MKKTLVILIALVFTCAPSFAQTQADTAAQEPAAENVQAPAVESAQTMPEQITTFIGKVVTVTVADPANGISESGLTVADDMGKTATYTVNESAKVIDAALNAVTLNQLKEGEKVSIESSKTAEGKEEASTIKVLP